MNWKNLNWKHNGFVMQAKFKKGKKNYSLIILEGIYGILCKDKYELAIDDEPVYTNMSKSEAKKLLKKL